MQTIGSQDGIVAFHNRLRDLDPAGTLLVKAGGKWPSIDTLKDRPLEEWKAIDKHQRMDQVLKDDHDAGGTVAAEASPFSDAAYS
jgi:hypothetical protein